MSLNPSKSDSIGYNEGKIKTCVSTITSAYNDLYKAVVTDVKSQVIDSIDDNWYSPEAVNYFKNYFKPNCENLTKAINNTFDNAITVIEEAASVAAKLAGATYSKKGFSKESTTCDVTGVKEKDGSGNRGINISEATTAIGKLDNPIKLSCDNALDKAVRACSGSGFLGGQQEANLKSSFNKIKKDLGDAFAEMKKEATDAIKATADNYKTLNTSIESSFTIK